MTRAYKMSEIFHEPARFFEKSLPCKMSMKKRYGKGTLELTPLKKGLSVFIYDFNYLNDMTIDIREWASFDKIWFFVCLSGTAHFTTKKREFSIFPGYSEIFKGDFDIPVKQKMKKNCPYKIVSLMFEPWAFTEMTGKTPEEICKLNLGLPPEKKKTPKALKMAAEQLGFLKQKDVSRKLFREAKALEIISYKLGQLEKLNEESQENIDFKKSYIERIYYAAEILEKNLVDPPGIFDIADLTGLNHNKLINGFKDIFELTPFEYLSKTRLHKAAELIKKDEYKITEAAFSVGYCNLSHFARIFKKEFGLNPSEYKKLNCIYG